MTPAGRSSGRILAVFAHPDDETFGAGGTLALLADTGHVVDLICATNGDEGGVADESGDHGMDPEVRLDELRCACRALGINEPVFLGYRDSGMEGWGAKPGSLSTADRDEVLARLVGEIRRLRPDVVVTFDPGGIYGHPDHVAISGLASEAYFRTAAETGGPRALYHQAIPRSAAEAWPGLEAEMVTATGGPPREPGEDERRQRARMVELARADDEISHRVDVRAVLDRKLAAFGCHASQVAGWRLDAVPRPLLETFLGEETFIRVDPPAGAGAPGTTLDAVL